MRVLGALAAWLLSGGIFGAGVAVVWANQGCAPSGTWKPFLTAVSVALFSTGCHLGALAGWSGFRGFSKFAARARGFSHPPRHLVRIVFYSFGALYNNGVL